MMKLLICLILISNGMITMQQEPASDFEHEGCFSYSKDFMYNVDPGTGHKRLATAADARSDEAAKTSCFDVANTHHIKYFGIHNKTCLVQLSDKTRFDKNGEDYSCVNGVGGRTGVDIYRNLQYDPTSVEQPIKGNHEGKEYTILMYPALNFEHANILCEQEAEELAQLESLNEIEFSKTLFQNVADWRKKTFWVGASRDQGSRFYWGKTKVAPVYLTGTDQNWADNQPVAASGNNTNCVAISGLDNLKWIADDCGSFSNYPLCEQFYHHHDDGDPNVDEEIENKDNTGLGTIDCPLGQVANTDGNCIDEPGAASQDIQAGDAAVQSSQQDPSSQCSPGYRLSKYGGCIDIDECAGNPCGYGWCENAPGSYKCVCWRGVRWDATKKTCVDINECDDPTSCVGGSCENFMRTYACRCPRGYHLNHANTTCVDTDECANHEDICHINARCINLAGGYRCECMKQFIGDGITDCRLSALARSSFQVTCHPNLMKIKVEPWVIQVYGLLTLRDTKCEGVKKTIGNSEYWVFSIRHFLADCENMIQKNETHFIYSNVLTNKKSISNGGGVSSGNTLEARWSCAFKSKNLPTTLQSGHEIAGVGFVNFHYGQPNRNGVFEGPYRAPMRIPEGGDVVDGSPTVYPDLLDAAMGPSNYSLDGEVPDDFVPERAPVLEGVEIAGMPILPPVTLPNGTVVIPGKNYPLPKFISDLLPDIDRDEQPGIRVLDASSHDLNKLDGVGKYLIYMWPYTDETYLHIERKTIYKTRDVLHIRAFVSTTDTRISVIATNCWGTPLSNPSSLPSIQLISNGCAVPDVLQNSIEVFSNGESRAADFKTQIFKFKGHNTTFIHCRVDLCDLSKHDCRPRCSETLNRRKRRSVDMEVEKTLFELSNNSLGHERITIGPFYINYHEDETGAEEQQNSPLIIVIPIVASVALIVIVGIIVLGCVRCRAMKQERAPKRRVAKVHEENLLA
ncbi:uncharacterized protein LOC143464889 isoform X2 [Clavelina lepadiformis]|uniref:uncharacterized protein LOC143464889 isoform X2 n=1 Tax=Clavelina lepadiformis TaxID=159417 RepID=UPI00404124CF